MPRIRSLKPEMASDVKLASVSIQARYTFVLMITQADDIGLLAGSHRQLLGTLYPVDDAVTIAALLGWIEELVAIGLVRWRATRDGVPVLQITKWGKHQRIDNAGRSQLGALLAESPADPPTLAEVRGESPQVAEDRGISPLGPRTKDLGPRTEDQGSSDQVLVSPAIVLASAANRGLAEHPSKPQPLPRITWSQGSTVEAVTDLETAGVPVWFAESKIYELARSHRSDSAIRSLRYFVDATVRAWQEYRAAQQVANTSAPQIIPGGPRKGNQPESVTSILGRLSKGEAANG